MSWLGTWRSPSLESADDKGSARLFVALFDYDPVSMSPNRDAAEEELPFQEGQILKVRATPERDIVAGLNSHIVGESRSLWFIKKKKVYGLAECMIVANGSAAKSSAQK